MRERKDRNLDYTILINKIQAFINKSCILLVIILLITQLLFTIEPMNFLLNKSYGLEGSSVNYLYPVADKGDLQLTIQDPLEKTSEVQVLLNGEIYSISQKSSIAISAKEDDIIELRGVNIQKPIRIKITHVSDNIALPKINSTYILSNSYELMGKIKFK